MGQIFSIFAFIPQGLGQILNAIYNTVAFKDYGLALIIFTLIIRAAILPLTFKQQKSMTRTQELQPKIQEIQKKYKNDKEKLNQELMKFYKDNNANPVGGCLPLLIQMPILISMWQVISRPLTYMLLMSDSAISKLAVGVPKISSYTQLNVVNAKPDLIHMNFLHLNINLGLVPKWDPNILLHQPQYIALILLPLLATATTFISTKLSMVSAKANQNQSSAAPGAAGMQNTMMYIAPLMTLFFSFTFPAGLSLYWIVGNCVQIVSQRYINKNLRDKKKEVVIK
jgi:YidC/Oxa1 family membrane protein insertase